MSIGLAIAVVLIALAFTYINGFHDTANSIATVVATKVMTPGQAVLMAAVTNLIGALWGTAVAKTIEKFAERYEIVAERLVGVEFAQRALVLERSSEVVAEMIGELRRGLRIDPVKKLQDRLQTLESEGDRMLLSPYRTLYVEGNDAMRAMLAKDLFELIEKAIDKCRDVGNIVYSIVLKNS